jgi:BirA family biotin operon repressor/biotin-[acetyl-CoA-carboxylase] ligase
MSLGWEALQNALQAHLAAQHPELAVEVMARVDSTSDALRERVRVGAASPTLLVAREQTRGRGRNGQSWLAAPDATLTFSVLLPLMPGSWAGLSLAIGLAVAEALDPTHQQPRLGLKWPNDLCFLAPDGPRKLGGILIETLGSGAQRWVVLGIGLNVGTLPAPLAQAVQAPAAEATGSAATSALATLAFPPAALSEWQEGLSVPDVLLRIASPVLSALKSFESQGFTPAQQHAYAQRDVLYGRPVHTLPAAGTRPGEAMQGIAQGVGGDGSLCLQTPQGLVRVHSGQWHIRPQAAAGFG